MDYRLLFILSCAVFSLLLNSCSLDNGKEIEEQEYILRISDDLYIAGGQLTVEKKISGDLVAAGGLVVISDSVKKDIWVAGGEVNVNSPAGDDVRIFGGKADINESVEGDVLVFGGEAIISEGVVVKGELHVYAGDVTIDGKVEGPVSVYAGRVDINGELGSKLECSAGKLNVNGIVNGDMRAVATEIKVGPEASFLGSIRYWCDKGEVDFGKSLAYGTAIFDKNLKLELGNGEGLKYLGMGLFFYMVWLSLAMFLVMLFLNWVFAEKFSHAGESLRDDLPRSFLYGFLLMIGFPIAGGLLLMSFVGIPLGIFIFSLYAILFFFGKAIAALVLAWWTAHNRNTGFSGSRIVILALMIFVVLKLIGLIPILGWSINLTAVCATIGALITDHFRRMKRPVATYSRLSNE